MIQVVQYFFFILILIGVGLILWTKNVIHAVYSLALVLVSLAGIYVLLNAELLAIVQILLYAGGVVILLVFGVMMTSRMKGRTLATKSKNSLVALILSVAIFTSLSFVFSEVSFSERIELHQPNQVEDIGISFLTDHIVAFELIAFILLVALVGAAYLAKISSNE